MTNKKYIETITFDEIINQALEQKKEIAQNFLDTSETYKGEYVYFTLIADFRQDNFNNKYYLNFIVDSETDNGYVMGFNIKLMTLCTEDYSEDEIAEELIIDLLEKELNKLKIMTTLKNKD